MKSFNKNDDYIDILEILKTLWAYKLPIIALGVMVSMIFALRVQFMIDDTYIATGVLYVSNRNETTEDADKAISKNDIDTAVKMSQTYIEMLNTRSFLTDVQTSEAVNGKYNWQQIKSMMNISTINNTQLLQISVRAKSPEDAYILADAILNMAPDKLKSVFKNGEVEIVDDAVVPTRAIDKGLTNNVVKGFIVGVALAVAAVVALNLFDTKIHKAEEISNRYNISVLGEIAQ